MDEPPKHVPSASVSCGTRSGNRVRDDRRPRQRGVVVFPQAPFGRGPDDRHVRTHARSTYLAQFWYDCCTHDDRALRYLIDTPGIGPVVLGTEIPAAMSSPDAAQQIMTRDCLTDKEEQSILSGDAEALLGPA